MGVTIEITNGGLGGTVQTNDGIMGLACTGASEGDYTVGDAILLTGMASLKAAGITAAGNAFAYKQVKEFYDEAGDGARLYLMLVGDTVTADVLADKLVDTGVVKLLDYADGNIKVLGIVTDDTVFEEVTIEDGLNVSCYDALTLLQQTAEAYAAKQQPFRGIVGMTSYQGVPAVLVDQTEDSNNRVMALVGDTVSGAGACVGLMLGRLAKSQVQQKASRVKTGKLAILTAYLNDVAINSSNADPDILRSAGYVTLMAYPDKAGFFFSGDQMATATTDDFNYMARGRVIDKCHRIAYQTYVNEVDEDVPLKSDGSGTLKTTYIAGLENKIVQAINDTLGRANEISSVRCYVDPSQRVGVTNSIDIVVSVVPKGYLSEIAIKLGFAL